MRIHIFPWRFILRAMATRAASICFVSSQQRSSAIRPYSPNATVLPRYASPARLPRCILRNLTLAGCNGITKILYSKSFKKLASPLLDRNRLSLHGRLRFGRLVLAFADPAFDAELAVNGQRFGETVINVRAQRVQRNAAPV